MKLGRGRLAMYVLWPAFLVAAMAEGAFFSMFEPEQLSATLPPVAIYSIGFFMFWSVCTLASLLTAYLVVPGEDGS